MTPCSKFAGSGLSRPVEGLSVITGGAAILFFQQLGPLVRRLLAAADFFYINSSGHPSISPFPGPWFWSGHAWGPTSPHAAVSSFSVLSAGCCAARELVGFARDGSPRSRCLLILHGHPTNTPPNHRNYRRYLKGKAARAGKQNQSNSAQKGPEQMWLTISARSAGHLAERMNCAGFHKGKFRHRPAPPVPARRSGRQGLLLLAGRDEAVDARPRVRDALLFLLVIFFYFFSFLPCPLPCQRELVCRIADRDAMISVSQPQPAPIPVGLVQCSRRFWFAARPLPQRPRQPDPEHVTRALDHAACACTSSLDSTQVFAGSAHEYHSDTSAKSSNMRRSHACQSTTLMERMVDTRSGPLTDALVEHPLGLVRAAFLEDPACFCASGAVPVPGWA